MLVCTTFWFCGLEKKACIPSELRCAHTYMRAKNWGRHHREQFHYHGCVNTLIPECFSGYLREFEAPAAIHVDMLETCPQAIALSKSIHGKTTNKFIKLDRPAHHPVFHSNALLAGKIKQATHPAPSSSRDWNRSSSRYRASIRYASRELSLGAAV